MAKCIRLLATIGVIGILAACTREQQTEEYVVVDQPVSSAPTYTGKYR